MHHNTRALLAPLSAQWQGNFQALTAGGDAAIVRGSLAKKGLSALRELLHVMPNWQGVEEDMRTFLEAVHAASVAIMPTLNAGVHVSTKAPAAFIFLHTYLLRVPYFLHALMCFPLLHQRHSGW